MQASLVTPVVPDEHLVDRHRYGDEEAFTEIFHRFSGLIYNVSFRMAGDHGVAEDLAQEVFLRIHRHLHKFAGRSSLKTWIYRVTVNHCRSRLGRKRLPTRPLDYDEGRELQVADQRRGPEGRVEARDAAELVQRALAAVPSPYREAVILRDLEELEYGEIAEVLGVRIGTVRSRIARGRERLRRQLVEGVSA